MDNKKVEQVLKKIFDQYGTEIVQNRKKFIGAIFDLLDEWNYKNERIVLKHATESNAFSTLLAVSLITGDAAERAVRQIQDETRMTKEDAEFIVRCVIAARGQDPDIVTENEKKRQQEDAERLWKAEEEQKRQEETRKQQEIKQNQQEEAQKRYETEQKYQDNKDRNSSQEYIQTNQEKQESNNCIFEIECKRQTAWQLFGHLGKLYLYPEKLLFIPYKKKKQTEIFYRDITKFWTYRVVKWLLLIYMFLFALLWLGIEPETGIMISVYFLILTPIWVRICNRCIHIPNKWSTFRGCTFIFCGKADKKQAVAAIKERIRVK